MTTIRSLSSGRFRSLKLFYISTIDELFKVCEKKLRKAYKASYRQDPLRFTACGAQ